MRAYVGGEMSYVLRLKGSVNLKSVMLARLMTSKSGHTR
jgi:hypothetical protein